MKGIRTKLTESYPTSKIAARTVACIFLEHTVASSIFRQIYVLKTAYTCVKFFVAVCCTLEWNNITTIKYHPQMNRRARGYNSTAVLRTSHYVAELQKWRESYLLPVTYCYDVQVNWYIKISSFSLPLTRTTSGPVTVMPKCPSLAPDDDITSPLYERL